MVIRENRPLKAAAEVLDVKLEALVTRAMDGRPADRA
jgi:hypothetical protein